MRLCSECNVLKPETNYYVKDSKTGRLHTQCKECYRKYRTGHYAKHYAENREKYQQRAKTNRAKMRNEFRKNMIEFLKNKHCEVCGEDDIRTFEFDHINPIEKRFSISQAVRLGYKWKDVLIEIEKCRILCANCHKKYTASQFGWYKN